jgi:hypothetical protein
VIVDGLSERNGEVHALSVLVSTTCPLAHDSMFTATASVGAPHEGGDAFTMSSSVAIAARDRCGPSFYLYGRGGCSDVHTSIPQPSDLVWVATLLMIGVGAIRFVRRRASRHSVR